MSSPLDQMLDRLRAEAARMAGQVQQMVSDAVEATARGDAELARRVIAVDRQIDEAELRVEKTAIDLLSLFRPAAGEFRLALMVIKVNHELERAADCAANVAERVEILAADAEQAGEPYRVPDELTELGSVVSDLLRRSIKAFNFLDCPVAEQVMKDDDRADALYAQVVQDALSDMRRAAGRIDRDMAHIMLAKNLERIGDHCTNIAEDIVYIKCGQVLRHRHAV